MSRKSDSNRTGDADRFRPLILDAQRQAARAYRGAGSSSSVQFKPDGRPIEALGPTIAGYRILREVHRGGQGVVYEALQESTQRRVAVKVMRDGPFASPSERARFDREVRVLAQLNHPNIVAIHEGGHAAGHDYFVMNFVDGRPLDHRVFDEDVSQGRDRAHRAGPASAQAQKRKVDAVLQTFVTVCEAVNAAHVRGVMHRDLKPSNILVDAGGVPRVLDFGLAKTVADDSGPDNGAPAGRTLTGQFVGSLPWASPEQAEAASEKVDLRTDVYALGVMLYQCLTGRFPYPVGGPPEEALHAICTLDPVRPRSLNRAINEEVETIVLKCLAKDRERRYQSAGGLGRDLQRYLVGEPIDAKRDAAAYVVAKYLRRYRWRIGIAASFVAVVAGAAVTSTLLWRQAARDRDVAREERLRADARVAQLRSLARTFIYDLDEKIRDLPGATDARLFVAHTALDYLDALAADPLADRAWRVDLGLAYRKVGEVLGRPMHANLGKYALAAETLSKSRAVLSQLVLEQPDDLSARRELAATEMAQGDVDRVGGQLDAAAGHYQNYCSLSQYVAQATNEPRDRREVAIGLLLRSDVAAARGLAEEALQHARAAVELLDALPDAAGYSQDIRRDRSVAYARLGSCLLEGQDPAAAREWYLRSLAINEARRAADAQSVTAARDVTVDHLYVGQTLVAEGRFDQALPHYEAAVELREDLFQADPSNSQAERDLATACFSLGDLFTGRAHAAGRRPDQQRADLQRAREALHCALERWTSMRDRGVLRASDAGAGDEIRGAMEQVERALAALEGSPES